MFVLSIVVPADKINQLALKNMKKKTRLIPALLPLVITLSTYVVFYSRIESKPNHVGFWFILLLGVSLGVALTRVLLWSKDKDNV